MFANVGAARDVLSEYFYEESVDMLVGLLAPAIVFDPVDTDQTSELGVTRIGGTPDLPKHLPWPLRAVPEDAEAIAARGGSHHRDRFAGHLQSAQPFSFIAQVDLAEAAALGDVAAGLPSEGRLHFFYDGIVGTWCDGTGSCRVIWDTTPVTNLERLSLPKPLIDAFMLEFPPGARAGVPPQDGATLSERTKSPYWGPGRAMRLRPMLRLPDWRSAEVDSGPFAYDELVEWLKDDDFAASYRALFDDHINSALRQQLLGMPMPEQDDPRCSAVMVSEFGNQDVSPKVVKENWPRIVESSAQWRLLLQIDQRDYLQQELVEGTIYFLIRHADLAARAFEKVVGIYQQT